MKSKVEDHSNSTVSINSLMFYRKTLASDVFSWIYRQLLTKTINQKLPKIEYNE